MSSLHDHNFKDLPTDWRHDGPLSARNDEKHLPPAMRAAGEIIATIRHTYGGRLYPESKIAEIIDREAVKPATAELLAVLNDIEPALVNLHCALQGTACMDPRDQRIAVITGGVVRDLQVLAVKVRAAIASFTSDSRQHEART